MYGVEPSLTTPSGMPLRNDVPPAFLPGAGAGGESPTRNLIGDHAADWDIFPDDRADRPAAAELNDISEISDDGSTADADDLVLPGGHSDDEDFFNE